MRQNHRAFAGAFQAFNDAVRRCNHRSFRRNTPRETVERVFIRVEAARPVLIRKWRAGYREVEGF